MVTAKELGASGAMAALLVNAMRPNVVQSLENTLALVHGGPFANIAHGCSSVAATRAALSLTDYVVTEAGFGADLGAEKFVGIKCRQTGLAPKCAVVVATVRALKMHGGVAADKLAVPDAAAVARGMPNLQRHLENLALFGLPRVVAINLFVRTPHIWRLRDGRVPSADARQRIAHRLESRGGCGDCPMRKDGRARRACLALRARQRGRRRAGQGRRGRVRAQPRGQARISVLAGRAAARQDCRRRAARVPRQGRQPGPWRERQARQAAGRRIRALAHLRGQEPVRLRALPRALTRVRAGTRSPTTRQCWARPRATRCT